MIVKVLRPRAWSSIVDTQKIYRVITQIGYKATSVLIKSSASGGVSNEWWWQNPTWNADIEKISSGRALASISVKIKENSAQNGQEDAPRMRRRVHYFIDDIGLVRNGSRVNIAGYLLKEFLLGIDIAH